jgi:hypothetical protein
MKKINTSIIKKVTLTVSFGITFLLFLENINGQNCLPDGILFNSQEQIDSFPIFYPTCNKILGQIIIQETFSGDITNLNGLSNLTSTGSTLWIKNNSELSDISGLENISSIGGFFECTNNDGVTDFNSLSNLSSIALGLYIEDNGALTSLDGLENITSLSQFGMSITNNEVLTNVN